MVIVCTVTRRRLALTTRDTTTGWRRKTWTNHSVEGILLPKGSQRLATQVGTYVRTDALFMTMDSLLEGEEIETRTGQFYEVHAPREYYVGDSFSHRECDLTLLPMHADIDVTAYNSTPLVDDARHRQKVYIEQYWVQSNCGDDLDVPLGVVVMYAEPNYPLNLELKDPNSTDIIITIGKPESKPIRGHDFIPYGYEETVPIGIWAMDKTNVTAVKAVWQCEAELRRILEEHPIGSLRGFDKTSEGTRALGSAILYGIEYKIKYVRDLT